MKRADATTGGGLRAATVRRRPRLSVGEQYLHGGVGPDTVSVPPARQPHRMPRPARLAGCPDLLTSSRQGQPSPVLLQGELALLAAW